MILRMRATTAEDEQPVAPDMACTSPVTLSRPHLRLSRTGHGRRASVRRGRRLCPTRRHSDARRRSVGCGRPFVTTVWQHEYGSGARWRAQVGVVMFELNNRGETVSEDDARRRAEQLDINTSTSSIARAYDYLLGGKDNFAVDRAASASLTGAVPEISLWPKPTARSSAKRCGIWSARPASDRSSTSDRDYRQRAMCTRSCRRSPPRPGWSTSTTTPSCSPTGVLVRLPAIRVIAGPCRRFQSNLARKDRRRDCYGTA